jgi:hypothetical protein
LKRNQQFLFGVSFRTALKFPFAILCDPAWATVADDMGDPRDLRGIICDEITRERVVMSTRIEKQSARSDAPFYRHA